MSSTTVAIAGPGAPLPPLDALMTGFITRTLPKSAWTHEAHLRVGAWHVQQHGLEKAMVLLRNRIARYNVSVGGVNSETDGYHETITWFYLVMIADLRRRAGNGLSLVELADRAVAELGDRDLPYRYYSKEYLMSVAARRGIVGPDLAPLPSP